jgi:hypothetical protein
MEYSATGSNCYGTGIYTVYDKMSVNICGKKGQNIRWNAPNYTIKYVHFVEHILPEIGISDLPQDSNIRKN